MRDLWEKRITGVVPEKDMRDGEEYVFRERIEKTDVLPAAAPVMRSREDDRTELRKTGNRLLRTGSEGDGEELFWRLHGELLGHLEHYREMRDEEIYQVIDRLLLQEGAKEHIRLRERKALRVRLFNAVRRLDILQELLDQEEITEIMVNGLEGIYIEKRGAITRWNKSFDTQEKLEDIVQQIVAGCNRVANEATAIVDARLSGGERVNIVMAPVAIDGPIITIRRFPSHPIGIRELVAWGSISECVAGFLRLLVISGYNIFISGGTGSGKTTFLNALSDFIPKDERIITIEDNAELQIRGVDNLVRLEARKANAEGDNAVTIRDLIKTSLRMRPTRIIVGEVRGEETVDLLMALNTGHDGSLSTGHGNSPRDMLGRLETMYTMGLELPLTAIRRQIASGIDIMVHLGRLRDKSRRVLEILEIDGYEYQTGEILTHTLYEFRETGVDEDGRILGGLVQVGDLRSRMKLQRAGLTLEETYRLTS